MSDKPGIFILVDMEGISGITQSSQVMPDQPGYPAARKWMAQDVNACVEGCFRGSAGRVVVRDAHYRGLNMLWDEVDGRADLIQGSSGLQRMTKIETFDAVILLGYHAMHGTRHAILEHTWSPESWQRLWINGIESGEIALDSAIAGTYGKPVVMVSGDDKACAEARQFIPGVRTAQVKTGLALHGGQLLARDTAHALIRDTAEQAVRHYREVKPVKASTPATIRLELVSRHQVPAHLPHVKVIDGRTYEVTAETVEKALHAL